MTHKERFTAALRREPVQGNVPTFEMVFYLTMEVFGKVHPAHRSFVQWTQMSEQERILQRNDIADIYINIAKKYDHDCIHFYPSVEDFDEIIRTLYAIRERGGEDYFIIILGDPTFGIPNGENMMDMSLQFYEEPEEMHRIAQAKLETCIKRAEKLSEHNGLLDGFAMCEDYCFNTNPFLSPAMFGEFIAPYLQKTCDAYRDMGFYSIKHTDGNINPIVDQLVQCGPDALHSLDPQGGVSLAEIKRLYGDRVALCGNVNCGLLQTGTDVEVASDVRRSLREGMDGWGYIFSTSNCVYTGLDVKRYDMMMDIWRKEGIYS